MIWSSISPQRLDYVVNNDLLSGTDIMTAIISAINCTLTIYTAMTKSQLKQEGTSLSLNKVLTIDDETNHRSLDQPINQSNDLQIERKDVFSRPTRLRSSSRPRPRHKNPHLHHRAHRTTPRGHLSTPTATAAKEPGYHGAIEQGRNERLGL